MRDRCGDTGVQVRSETPLGLPSPDIYFLPGYGRAASIADGGKWVLVEDYDGAWQVPLIVRTMVNGTKDAISPTFSGIYASPTLSPVQLLEAWSATACRLQNLGVISVLLRQSPLLPPAPDLPGLRSISSGRPTIVLELSDGETAWKGMEGRCRTSIRKALKNGYPGDIRQAAGQDLAPTSDFRRLYEQTMLRRDAAPLYFFKDDYYRALLDGLGPQLIIAEVRDSTGVVVSSALLMRHGQRLHYHLSGSDTDGARMGSNNLMLWTAAQFAITQGLRQFHLGSGVGVQDDLFKFKRSFGGRQLDYDVFGMIIDHELYQAHTQNRAKACDVTADSLLASNYFPAYRGGVPRV